MLYFNMNDTDIKQEESGETRSFVLLSVIFTFVNNFEYEYPL